MSQLLEYYRNQFPAGVRGEKYNPDSIVYQLDTARIQALDALLENILLMADQFQVRTATIGLDDWEEFLDIPTDTTLSFGERRARILVKLSPQPATISNIKLVAKEITGVDIQIFEYGRLGSPYYDPVNHPWKVKIVVDRNLPGAKSFKKSFFERMMRDIFPAHTEWDADSFVYIAFNSYLMEVTGGKQPLILDQQYLQVTT